MDIQSNDVYFESVKENRVKILQDTELRARANLFQEEIARKGYTYFFSWLGLPIIQVPEDILFLAGLFYRVKPSVIIETGVARGGSVIFWSSMFAISNEMYNHDGKVIGVDLFITDEARANILSTGLAKRIQLIEGSSTDEDTFNKVLIELPPKPSPMIVMLDSDHCEAHVLKELEMYSSLLNPGDYIVVMDTSIESNDPEMHALKSWGPGNSPWSAVDHFLEGVGKKSFSLVDDEVRSNLFSCCIHGVLKKS